MVSVVHILICDIQELESVHQNLRFAVSKFGSRKDRIKDRTKDSYLYTAHAEGGQAAEMKKFTS